MNHRHADFQSSVIPSVSIPSAENSVKPATKDQRLRRYLSNGCAPEDETRVKALMRVQYKLGIERTTSDQVAKTLKMKSKTTYHALINLVRRGLVEIIPPQGRSSRTLFQLTKKGKPRTKNRGPRASEARFK